MIAHIYHSHFKEIVLLNLHPHLNCIFAHIVLFNEGFKLIEEKEMDVLKDLAIALKLYPPVSECDDTQEIVGTSHSNDDNNNAMSSDYCNEQVITTQCRSISAFDNYKNCYNTLSVGDNSPDTSDMKENDGETDLTCLNDNYLVNSPMLVDDNEEIKNDNSFLVASPEPMFIEPMTSSENIPKKFILDSSNSFRARSISANAVLSSSKSLEAFPISPITRRCNSDRTSTKSNSNFLYNSNDQHRNHLFQPNYDSRATCGR